MNPYETAKMKAKENVSMPIVVSSALGAMVASAVLYFAMKSGIKPLKKAAKVAGAK